MAKYWQELHVALKSIQYYRGLVRILSEVIHAHERKIMLLFADKISTKITLYSYFKQLPRAGNRFHIRFFYLQPVFFEQISNENKFCFALGRKQIYEFLDRTFSIARHIIFIVQFLGIGYSINAIIAIGSAGKCLP